MNRKEDWKVRPSRCDGRPNAAVLHADNGASYEMYRPRAERIVRLVKAEIEDRVMSRKRMDAINDILLCLEQSAVPPKMQRLVSIARGKR